MDMDLSLSLWYPKLPACVSLTVFIWLNEEGSITSSDFCLWFTGRSLQKTR